MDVGDKRKRGSVFAIPAVVLLAYLLAGCASSAGHRAQATAGATPPGTSTVHFHAFGTDGALLVPTTARVVRGQCWTASIAAPESSAYRCFQGNKILDPCFAPDDPASPPLLACMDTPWSKALRLHVTGKLPKPAAGASVPTRPWALELDTGLRCVSSTGTVPSLAGVNLTYRCSDGGNAALGGPSGGSLTVRYAAPQAKTLTTMTIATVWEA
jgi:hypothetical protein